MKLTKTQKERYEKGLCINCDTVRVTTRLCQKCCDKHYEYSKAMKSKKREKGLCINCGKPKSLNSFCPPCLNKRNKYQTEYREKRIKNGECVSCGKNSQTRLCPKCTEGRSNYRRSEKAILARRNWKKRNSFVHNENVLENIRSFIPKDLEWDVRDDVIGELLFLLCSNKLNFSDIEAVVKKVIKEQRKFLPSKYQVHIDGLEDYQRDKLEGKFSKYNTH
jgi:hypothetical protein